MDHLMVAAEAGTALSASARLADPWGQWLKKFLWESVYILTISTPSEIMKTFLEKTMSFLLDHEVGGGGGGH